MADNFNLRQFLTENKLTKNAKLLKEEQEDYKYFDEEGTGGFYMTTIDGVKIYSLEDSSIMDTCFYALEDEDGYIDFISIDVSGEPVSSEDIQNEQEISSYIADFIEEDINSQLKEEGLLEASDSMKNKMNEEASLNGKPVDIRSIEIEDIDTSDYPDFTDAYITYAEYKDGTPLTEEELIKFEEENYGIVGELILDRQLYLEGNEEEMEEGIHDRNILSRPSSNPAIEPLDRSPEELTKDADARSENMLRMKYYNQIQDTNISDEELRYILSGKGAKGFGGTPNAVNNILASRSRMEEVAPASMQAGFDMVNSEKRKHAEMMRVANKLFPEFGGNLENFKPLSSQQREMVYQNLDSANIKEAKSYKVSKNSKEAQHLKKGDIIGSGDEVVSVSAGARTPSGKVEVTLKTKDGKTKTSTWGKTTKIGVKEKETVKENKMTQRDKYLTRLVENALGLEVTEDDNVDYTMGRHDDPNQLPNPAPEITIPEGEEMVEEKPMPKYESIEKLMQEIDKSTDEEAHKFKMQEMKRVADGLEKKATALEEGDDADHIDQKKLKQMKKDIMTLRKGIEKMEKLGDKKFTKKETKADLKEGFDLRKYLVENKMTSNSRTQE